MKLTENFSLEEFKCPCCDRVKVNERFGLLVETMQKLRELWGPIEITSGYRCPKRNYYLKQLGYTVSPNTRHEEPGDASDFRPHPWCGDRDELVRLYNLAKSLNVFGFLKLYESHIHGDMRGR